MNGLKKFLKMFCMTAILICVIGCGSDKSNKDKTEPPPVTIQKSFGTDLGITADQFVAKYNGALDHLANKYGDNYDNRKITFDNPKNVEQTKNVTIHFYPGKYCTVSVHKNSPSSANICGADLSVYAGYNFSDILTEVGATLIAVAKERGDYSKVVETVQRLLKSGGTNTTSVDGLLIHYDPKSGLMIFAEDATLNVVANLKQRVRKI